MCMFMLVYEMSVYVMHAYMDAFMYKSVHAHATTLTCVVYVCPWVLVYVFNYNV
jgi:hypothetical protein